jgi:hypothetical protein
MTMATEVFTREVGEGQRAVHMARPRRRSSRSRDGKSSGWSRGWSSGEGGSREMLISEGEKTSR